jgi:hypothetical protein
VEEFPNVVIVTIYDSRDLRSRSRQAGSARILGFGEQEDGEK